MTHNLNPDTEPTTTPRSELAGKMSWPELHAIAERNVNARRER